MSIPLERTPREAIPEPQGVVTAEAGAAELLAFIESAEATGCDWTAITTGWIRAQGQGAATFAVGGATFETAAVGAASLILNPLTREVEGRRTLRPFAELLVTRRIQRVRVVATGWFERHHEYTCGNRWARLVTQKGGEK